MEAAAGASAAARKEWRVVSEQSVRDSSNEEFERSKVGQSDERLIYEVQHGRGPVDVDFCSISIDGGLDNDVLQQRLHTVAKQREELQQIEIELRAQVIARSEILGMHNTFDAQIKEHENANVKLQERLHEKEQKIHELERKMDDKERELRAIRLDNEAAWAKEDLLREQSKELQSYMRERDSSEAERVQQIKQIHDFQEHIHEKERQFMELQEQHKTAQETILFKEEQIREAQAWITRAQEMDALQSTTNHTLQAELRERTEQYNQLWLGCQRQFGEMERLHMYIQQLQLELADVREKSGSYSDASHVSQTNSKDPYQLGQGNGSQLEVNGNTSPSAKSGGVQNGSSESGSSFASGGNTSTQTDHVHGVAFAPTSLLGMPTYLPNGQVTALHPFVMHQQGVPHPSHVTQSHFHSVAAMSPTQNWQNQQALPDGQHVPLENQYPQQTEQNFLRTDSPYEASVNGQVLQAKYFNTSLSQGLDADAVVPSPNGEVLDSIDKSSDNAQSQQSLQQISSQFQDAVRLNNVEHDNDTKEKKVAPVSDQGLENTNKMERSNFPIDTSSVGAPTQAVNFSEATIYTSPTVVSNDAFVSTGQNNNIVGKPANSYLLDERALLASIARTIGSGGRIRIGSTLPNRLAKMLAPLHWHDYKKMYGKLDDFVASHPELFLIEGDYIQLRGGAQEIIAAKAAAAKVAAAGAPSSYSSLIPSVAVTPMSQSHRFKKVSSSVNDKVSFNEFALHRPSKIANVASQFTSMQSQIANVASQFTSMQSQNLNGGSINVAGVVSNVRILGKPKDHVEKNGSESRPGRSSPTTHGNGTNSHKADFSQSIGASNNGRQSRTMEAASGPRR